MATKRGMRVNSRGRVIRKEGGVTCVWHVAWWGGREGQRQGKGTVSLGENGQGRGHGRAHPPILPPGKEHR